MKRKGFTLIEILAVIVILGILTLIAVPIVSNYIVDSRNKTYLAHEKDMEEAAKSYTIECIDGKENCILPIKDNSSEIHLSELIEKGYTERLQNPQGEGYCNEELSYVRVLNTGKSDYEYQACLYCGNYVTESNDCVPVGEVEGGVPPVCGTVTGQSSEWTNKPRTITVACTDPDNDCRYNSYPKTYKTTAVNDEIIIGDMKNHITRCPVNVKVDTDLPTCELEVVGGVFENQTNWISGDIKVKIKNYTDAHSGLLTYGMGTSMTPDYNRKSVIDLTDRNGLITVFGYVKDNAGNEGNCKVTLRTGVPKPEIYGIFYGYHIFPLKESYSTNNITVSNGAITTNGSNPTLTFSGMDKYTNAKRVTIITASTVNNPTDYKLSVDNGSHYITAQKIEDKRLDFELPRGTYNKYIFKIPNNITISRLEIQQSRNNIIACKNVSVNIHPDVEKEKVKIDKFSFDGGATFQDKYYKLFDVKDKAISGKAQVKNLIGMVSDKMNYSIVQGDCSGPTISLTFSPDTWTNGDVTLTGKGEDKGSGIIAYAFSKGSSVPYDSSNWESVTTTTSITKTDTATTNGDYYFNLKDDAGNIVNAKQTVSKIDKIKPECSITGFNTIKCTDTGNSDYAASLIDKYIYKKDAASNGTYTTVNATNNLVASPDITEPGTWNLYAKDRAGNISDKVSATYYKVTYDKNNSDSGSSCTKSSEILKDGTSVDLSATCSRTGYTFNGWSLDGNAVYALTISKNITLKARWVPMSFTIYYHPNKGSGNIQSRTVRIGEDWTTEGAIFTRTGQNLDGWATSETGNVSYSLSTPQGAYNRNSDLHLYAHWSPITYTITYVPNGGSGNNKTQTVNYNDSYTTLDKIYSRSGYKQVGWYERLAEYDYIECLYKVGYEGSDTIHYYGFYSFKVDKVYKQNEAEAFCKKTDNIATFKASDDYSRFVKWIQTRVENDPGTCTCDGDLNSGSGSGTGSQHPSANSQEACMSACTKNGYNKGTFVGKCSCSGNGPACSSAVANSNAITENLCRQLCQAKGGCSYSFSGTCNCTGGSGIPVASCESGTFPASSEETCSSQCRNRNCKSSYNKLTYNENNIKVTLDDSIYHKRYETKDYSANTKYTYTYDSDMTLYADWKELAKCPAGTTTVADAGTDDPKCCTNCSTVSNGSCSVSWDATNKKCVYNTSCNSGYKLVSGAGTNAPVCCQDCPSIAHGSCSVSWNGSSCVYTTSCEQGYRLSNNGTRSATCTRCEGWRLTNPNDDVFGDINKIQGQKWEYRTASDTLLTGWQEVHGDIYSNQVTTDSNGNGVCDAGVDNIGWFYLRKSDGVLKKGWVCTGNTWYFLWNGMGTGDFRDYPSGELSGRLVVNVSDFDIGGSKYSFNAKGECTKGTGCTNACSGYGESYQLN